MKVTKPINAVTDNAPGRSITIFLKLACYIYDDASDNDVSLDLHQYHCKPRHKLREGAPVCLHCMTSPHSITYPLMTGA